MFGKLIAKTLAAPVKIVVSIPDVAAETVEEMGKALSGEKKKA